MRAPIEGIEVGRPGLPQVLLGDDRRQRAASVTWTVCFTLLGARLTPFLWRARVDGRGH